MDNFVKIQAAQPFVKIGLRVDIEEQLSDMANMDLDDIVSGKLQDFLNRHGFANGKVTKRDLIELLKVI